MVSCQVQEKHEESQRGELQPGMQKSPSQKEDAPLAEPQKRRDLELLDRPSKVTLKSQNQQ